MEYNGSWKLKCFSKLSSNNENIISTPNIELKVVFINFILNIYVNGSQEFIYLTPETYIFYSNLHLGILSFDIHRWGKWCLSFYDEPSVINCVETLRNSSINVTDIQKLISDKKQYENAIIKTITNSQFPQFVAKIENTMKNKNNKTLDNLNKF